MQDQLLGVGLYTLSEAQRLLRIPSAKVRRWLTGHKIGNKFYPPLWRPQIYLSDGNFQLGFRDLLELRVANKFIEVGVSSQQVRRAIIEAGRFIDDERPLSTARFRTDGRSIFLEIASEESDARLFDLFKKQYAFSKILEQSLKDVEFDGYSPARWWIGSEKKGIVLDPARAFGQPIDSESGIPTSILSNAAKAERSIKRAAQVWQVKEETIRRAVNFEDSLSVIAA